MKTVLEELIEEIDWHYHAAEKEYLESKSRLSYTVFRTYDFCLKMATALLEKEKEQIMDAYYYDPNCGEIKDDGEQYYNETFKQQKK
jgi:hypothetical protein